MKKTTAIMPLAVATAIMLQGCEVRRDNDAATDAPSPAPSETLTAFPSASASESPVASIIRPDVSSERVVDLPPEPLELTVPFAEGGYELDEAAQAVLREALESEQLGEGWPIVLRGHTDSVGNDRANLAASRKRAEAAARWLVGNGVSEERITLVALGEQRPVAPNAHLDGTPDEAGRAKNRRVEIWIAPAGEKPGGDAAGPAEENSDTEEET